MNKYKKGWKQINMVKKSFNGIIKPNQYDIILASSYEYKKRTKPRLLRRQLEMLRLW